MSLEEAIKANTAAVQALTAILAAQANGTTITPTPSAANTVSGKVPAKPGKPAPAPVEAEADEPAAEGDDDLSGDGPDYVALRATCKDTLKELLALGDDGKTKAKAILAKVNAKNIAEIADDKLVSVTAAFRKILDA